MTRGRKRLQVGVLDLMDALLQGRDMARAGPSRAWDQGQGP